MNYSLATPLFKKAAVPLYFYLGLALIRGHQFNLLVNRYRYWVDIVLFEARVHEKTYD